MPTIPVNDRGSGPAGHPGRDLTTRRQFLEHGAKMVGSGVAAVFLCDVTQLTEMAEAAGLSTQPADVLSAYDWQQHNYVYLIDVRKCIGCGACVRACSRENNVPPSYFRTWVERYHVARKKLLEEEVIVDSPSGGINGFEPLPGTHVTKAFFFPKLCCHCTSTPCVQLCPVGASYRTLDGVVLVDEQRCIGCGYCVQACPYGSRFIHPETHTASKCTLCYHRLTRGLKPACVQNCPVRARLLGDTKQPGDEVRHIIETQSVRILQPELLTEPNCFYVGLSGEAR